jgi:uroporphyrinogen-III synthase
MRVLLTRSAEDSEALAPLLTARGIEAVIAPLLDVHPKAGATIDLAGAQAVLLTSANGARALARLVGVRDIAVFAVGDATARAARAAGFASVEDAAGDVTDLAALVARRLNPAEGALVHVAGTDVAGDLTGDLAARGFAVRRAVAYEARAAKSLPSNARAVLAAGTLDAVLLYSPRTARTFVALARQAALDARLGRVEALCLSEAVAAEARALRWRAVLIAARPETETLIALLAARP